MAVREFLAGRVRARIAEDGSLILTRAGAIGRGVPRQSMMWCAEQVADALRAATQRRGEDAICEARALRWALNEMKDPARR